MALQTIGACFLPYGFERQDDGTWVAFNREYFPLFVSLKVALPEKKLEKIAAGLRPQRDEDGKIVMFFLYGDDSSPWRSKLALSRYMAALDALISVKAEGPRPLDPKVWENHWSHTRTSLRWNTLGRPRKTDGED